MDDENDSDPTMASDEDLDAMFGTINDLLEEMFGPGPFGDTVQMETPEEVRIAVLCMKSGHALDTVADHMEEKDIDFQDPHAMQDADLETQTLVLGVSVLADPIQRFANAVSGNDDDDNPFKVSDGDDPIY